MKRFLKVSILVILLIAISYFFFFDINNAAAIKGFTKSLKYKDSLVVVSHDGNKINNNGNPDIIFGSSIYPESTGGYAPNWPYFAWGKPIHNQEFFIKTTISESQGNSVWFWPPGDGHHHKNMNNPVYESYINHQPNHYPKSLGKLCAANNIYMGTIYMDKMLGYGTNLKELSRIRNLKFVARDLGEWNGFLYQAKSSAEIAKIKMNCTSMQKAYNEVLKAGKTVIANKISDKYPNVSKVATTSGSGLVAINYAAGFDYILPEAYFKNVMMYTVNVRGAAHAYDKKTWGLWNAWEWQTLELDLPPYGGDAPLRLLKAGINFEYISGAKVILLESGNFCVNTCEPNGKRFTKFETSKGTIAMYDAPVTTAIRKTWGECWKTIKKDEVKHGLPEVRTAIVHGNLDGYVGWFIDPNVPPHTPVWAQWNAGEEWQYGAIERSWNLMTDVFLTERGTVNGKRNRWLAGLPWGQFDVVPANIPIQKLHSYKTLIFLGWNSMTDTIYNNLIKYVKNGGSLFISVPHFNVPRDGDRKDVVDDTYSASNLFRGGDLRELCGVKIIGKGNQITQIINGNTKLNTLPSSSYYVANVKITGSSVNTLISADAGMKKPLIIEHSFGKGHVFLLATWEYPGGKDSEKTTMEKVVSEVLRSIVKKNRGDIFITEKNSDKPELNCEAIAWTNFPASRQVSLINTDMDHSHVIDVHLKGKIQTIEIKPDGKITDVFY